MATARGEAELSAAERAYYLPAVHQAFADIHVKWNSVPNDSWVGNLYGARLSITHMLDQLRRRDA
ncbi:MAG TPA: hypothetical protein VD866_23180 [Urbifossiella sp.]|nr:hypothetical protein [Urbifossiella sp.]